MIKAVVLDIDGVIVGNKRGFNFPRPSKKVISALQIIHSNGVSVSLLTGKPTLTAKKDIKAVGIDNPHIADGGATIFNPIRAEIIHITKIKQEIIEKLFKELPDNAYANPFSLDKYFLQDSLKKEFTNTYSEFLGQKPEYVNNILDAVEKTEITKINIFAFNESEKNEITKAVDKLSADLDYMWTTNSHIKPAQVLVVTPKGASKRTGVIWLAKYLNVNLSDVLGVGDTLHDWDFIEICGYKAAMGNAMEDLKEKIDKGDARQFIGGHIDEDGLLDVFRYFKLI